MLVLFISKHIKFGFGIMKIATLIFLLFTVIITVTNYLDPLLSIADNDEFCCPLIFAVVVLACHEINSNLTCQRTKGLQTTAIPI